MTLTEAQEMVGIGQEAKKVKDCSKYDLYYVAGQLSLEMGINQCIIERKLKYIVYEDGKAVTGLFN